MRFNVRVCILVCVASATLLGTPGAMAGDFGLGIILGAPTGISAKLRTGNRRAFDAAAAWSLGKDDSFRVHADHLWQSHAFNVETQGVDVHYGIGGRLRFSEGKNADEFTLGLRAPVGLSALLNRSPVELFFEIALVMDVIPETDADFDAGVGVRYYF